MAELMIFKDVINENAIEFIARGEAVGSYSDEGDWVSGNTSIPKIKRGILLPLSEKELKYAEYGTYSVNDKKLFTVEPLHLGQEIEYKGTLYTIQSFKDYTDYTDVYIYIARWREK